MKKKLKNQNSMNGSLIPRVLTHDDAVIVYQLLFPDDYGSIPSRPDILFSLEGKWKGWKELLAAGSIEDEIEKSEEDARFINAWNEIFKKGV